MVIFLMIFVFINDISRLAKEFSNGLQGVIVGRALYDKKITFSDALQKIKEAKPNALN
mgnify:CR=1 FL=1